MRTGTSVGMVRRRFGRAAAVLLLAAVAAAPRLDGGALTTSGRYFRDSAGRVVILRGVNIAGTSKSPPFLSVTNAAQLDRVAELGFNVIRLVFNWEAYEPLPGQFNEAYAGYIETIAAAAWERGVYTVVDIHQDVYSRYVADGCGAGFPGWTLAPSSTPNAPDNGPACGFWLAKGIADPDMHQSFTDFYANTTGVRSAFLRMLGRLAGRLATNPGVIGYDILNEPWGSETLEIPALYADAVAAIRAVDPTAIAFVEPHILTGKSAQTGLTKPSFTNFVYAPHFYDTAIFTGAWAGGVGPMNTAFSLMHAKATEWGVPLFFGELGAPAGMALAAEYVRHNYDRLDYLLASSAQWSFTPLWSPIHKDGWNGEDLSIVDDQLNLRPNYAVRPFPRAVAGLPAQFAVSADRLTATFTWYHVASLGSTELFAPIDLLYGGQAPVVQTAGDALTCGYGESNSLLVCSSASNGLKNVIVRKSP